MGIMDKLTNIEPRGTQQTFMDTIISKLLDNLPPETLQQIAFIAERVRNVDTRLSDIETALCDIKTRLDNAGHISGATDRIQPRDCAGEQSPS